MADSFDGLKTLDRTLLMKRMAEELPAIREQMGISVGALAPKVSKGLFPEALKRAMATNRNEHIPETIGGI